jgi:hypothetical protein
MLESYHDMLLNYNLTPKNALILIMYIYMKYVLSYTTTDNRCVFYFSELTWFTLYQWFHGYSGFLWLLRQHRPLTLTTCTAVYIKYCWKKSLKIPKEKSESVLRRRTDNTTAKRKSTKGQTKIYKTYI